MTPEEEQMLNDLTDRVLQTRLTEKDPEAEQLLNQKLGRNPDALYILAQTVLVQKYALEQAQAQLQQMQQAPQQQPARATSFLGNLLGHHDPAPPPPPPPPPPQPGYGSAPYAQPWSQVPAYGPPPPAPGGGSSFLRTAATTAAGVAAGAIAFQGIESLMHGFGGGQPSLAWPGADTSAVREGRRRPLSTTTTTMPVANMIALLTATWVTEATTPWTCSRQATA